MIPNDFVNKYYPFAKQTQDKTGIDARFILAQAALETGWGKSAPGNMFFGVKANTATPMNRKQLLKTREVLKTNAIKFPEIISIKQRPDGRYDYVVKDWFRKYETPEESFTDHAKFFFDNPRYSSALKVKSNPYKFAEEIAKAGYATAPNYADSLKSIIKIVENYLQ